MAMKFLQLYFTYQDALDELSDEECGQVIKAVLHYAACGEQTNFPPRSVVRQTYLIMIRQYDSDQNGYDKRSAGGKMGGRPKKSDREPETDEKDPDSDGQKTTENLMREGFGGFHVKEGKGRERKGSSSSIGRDRETAACAAETMTTTTPVSDILETLSEVRGCQSTTARRELASWVDKLGHDAVMDIARDCVSAGAESWSYVRRALANRASGVDARPRGRNARVDRQTPGPGTDDFIRAAAARPRRLKRRDAADAPAAAADHAQDAPEAAGPGNNSPDP